MADHDDDDFDPRCTCGTGPGVDAHDEHEYFCAVYENGDPPLAPPRDLEPPQEPAPDITSGGPGNPPITDADITEVVVNIDLGDGSWTPQTMGNPVQQTELDVTRFGTKWVDGLGEVEISEAPDEVMFVGSDATIEVWRRPQPAGELAEASLVDADAVAEKSFVEGVAFHRFREATDVLLDHLIATEATRASAEPGEILPAFGLGEPPLYEVAAHAVQRETALQSAEMYRRSMERERTS